MEERSNLPGLFTRPSWALGQFGDWQSDFERFFDDFARRRWLSPSIGIEAFNPSVDVAESGEAIDVTAELPGCETKDVDIRVTWTDRELGQPAPAPHLTQIRARTIDNAHSRASWSGISAKERLSC